MRNLIPIRAPFKRGRDGRDRLSNPPLLSLRREHFSLGEGEMEETCIVASRGT